MVILHRACLNNNASEKQTANALISQEHASASRPQLLYKLPLIIVHASFVEQVTVLQKHQFKCRCDQA